MLKRKKILIVDDHKETRELIAEIFTKNGYEVFMAPGGREGFKLAQLTHPDIAILDINMPYIDGIQTCRMLKRVPQTGSIPVMFLTARGEKEKVKSALLAGGDDYMIKPFDPDVLITRVENILRKNDAFFDVSTVLKKKEKE